MDWPDLLPSASIDEVSPAGVPGKDVDLRETMAAAGLDAFIRIAYADGVPVTVVVNDAHRFTDTRSFLDAFFGLLDGGHSRAARPPLRLLVAAGSHIADKQERHDHLEKILGPHRQRFWEIEWHDARDASSHAKIGGVEMHHWMEQAGVYVGCGSMEPHYFAGVTGAHKTLTVGVMSVDGLQANHAKAMSPEATGLHLDGNPVYDSIAGTIADLENAGARLFALNEVIVGGELVAATAGHPIDALAEGLPVVRSVFSHKVPRLQDLVIACVEAPLDRDFYQADKGIKNTEAAVRDGGALLVEAECAGGVGLDSFLDLMREAKTYKEAVEVVSQRGYRLGDHKAVRLLGLIQARGVHVGVISSHLDPSLARVLRVAILRTHDEAAEWVHTHLGKAIHHATVVNDAGNLTLVT